MAQVHVDPDAYPSASPGEEQAGNDRPGRRALSHPIAAMAHPAGNLRSPLLDNASSALHSADSLQRPSIQFNPSDDDSELILEGDAGARAQLLPSQSAAVATTEATMRLEAELERARQQLSETADARAEGDGDGADGNDDDPWNGGAGGWRSSKLFKRARYYIPSIRWIPRYRLADLPSDLIAGLTIAFVLIPQGLSYASLAGLPPVYGLYTAFFPVLIFAFLTTSKYALPPATLAVRGIAWAQAPHPLRPASVAPPACTPLRRQLSVGPEAVVSILTGSALMGLAPDPADTELRISFNVTLTFFVGCITLVMGIMRLGFVECILSRATNRGFILGVAAVIIIEQLPKFFGLGEHVFEHTETPILKLVGVFEHLGDTKWQCAVMGIVGLAFLLVTGELKKKYSQYAWVRLFPTIMTLLITTLLINYAMQLPIPSLGGETDLNGGFAKPRAPKVRPCSPTPLARRCSRARR